MSAQGKTSRLNFEFSTSGETVHSGRFKAVISSGGVDCPLAEKLPEIREGKPKELTASDVHMIIGSSDPREVFKVVGVMLTSSRFHRGPAKDVETVIKPEDVSSEIYTNDEKKSRPVRLAIDLGAACLEIFGAKQLKAVGVDLDIISIVDRVSGHFRYNLRAVGIKYDPFKRLVPAFEVVSDKEGVKLTEPQSWVPKLLKSLPPEIRWANKPVMSDEELRKALHIKSFKGYKIFQNMHSSIDYGRRNLGLQQVKGIKAFCTDGDFTCDKAYALRDKHGKMVLTVMDETGLVDIPLSDAEKLKKIDPIIMKKLDLEA